MPINIVEYQPEHQAEVQAFNDRVKAHQIEFSLPKTPVSAWLPKLPGRPVTMEFWLALDGASVRGGYKLRHQNFILRGTEVMAANYQGPLSEGTIDRKYMMVGAQLLRSAVQKQPLLYALGMGGITQPLPKILKASGWTLELVPFFFRVLRPANFLRNIQPLRRSGARRLLADVAAFSGAGALGFWGLKLAKQKKRLSSAVEFAAVPRFAAWADQVWQEAKGGYLFSGVRDQTSQNIIFPETDQKNLKICVREKDRVLGWAVVRCTPMQNDKYFGNMRLGSIVDCFALPGREFDVVAAATAYLEKAGADLVITNQSHHAWKQALTDAAYLKGPSNFGFACSPKLAEQLTPWPEAFSQIHFNRSDGDGPIHL